MLQRTIFDCPEIKRGIFSPKKTYLCVFVFPYRDACHIPYIFDTETNAIICSPQQASKVIDEWQGEHMPTADFIDFSPDEKKFATCDRYRLWVFDFNKKTWSFFSGGINNAVKFIDNNRLICINETKIKIVDLQTGTSKVFRSDYLDLYMCHVDHKRKILTGFSKTYIPYSAYKPIKLTKNQLYFYAVHLRSLLTENDGVSVNLIQWFKENKDKILLLRDVDMDQSKYDNEKILENCLKFDESLLRYSETSQSDHEQSDHEQSDHEQSDHEQNEPNSNYESGENANQDDDEDEESKNDTEQLNGVYDRQEKCYVSIPDETKNDKLFIEVFGLPTKFFISDFSNNIGHDQQISSVLGQATNKLFYIDFNRYYQVCNLSYIDISEYSFFVFAQIIARGIAGQNEIWSKFLTKGLYDPRLLVLSWSFADNYKVTKV